MTQFSISHRDRSLDQSLDRSMGIIKRTPKDIQVPIGKDAVNFQKLLFLPLIETHFLLTTDEWERVRPLKSFLHLTEWWLTKPQLDFRCLLLMKTKLLRSSCIAREVDSKGGKRKLVRVNVAEIHSKVLSLSHPLT